MVRQPSDIKHVSWRFFKFFPRTPLLTAATQRIQYDDIGWGGLGTSRWPVCTSMSALPLYKAFMDGIIHFPYRCREMNGKNKKRSAGQKRRDWVNCKLRVSVSFWRYGTPYIQKQVA